MKLLLLTLAAVLALAIACRAMNTFIAAVRVLALSAGQATELVADSRPIKAVIGCA